MTVFNPKTTAALNAALDAMDRASSPSSSDGLVRCSDDALARRLRAKRLGIEEEPTLDLREPMRATFLDINRLVTAPWAVAEHPFARLATKAPRLHREMGAHVLDLFSDLTSEPAQQRGGPMARVVVLDGLDYERSASAGRSEQMLNEVRWFIDGQLALAWNVVAHRKVIEQWIADYPANESAARFNVEKTMPKCVRVHAQAEGEIEFRSTVSAWDKNTKRIRVTLGAKVKHALPMTVWGNAPVSSGNDENLGLPAALSTVHHFTAHA